MQAQVSNVDKGAQQNCAEHGKHQPAHLSPLRIYLLSPLQQQQPINGYVMEHQKWPINTSSGTTASPFQKQPCADKMYAILMQSASFQGTNTIISRGAASNRAVAFNDMHHKRNAKHQHNAHSANQRVFPRKLLIATGALLALHQTPPSRALPRWAVTTA